MSEKWERWNKEEYAILKKHYPNTPRKRLMQLLPGRTWKAITDAAERFGGSHRSRHDTPKSPERTAITHVNYSIARGKRIKQPNAGKRYTAEEKLHNSVRNLHTRGHSIADIAARKGVAEKEVKKIIENRKKKK